MNKIVQAQKILSVSAQASQDELRARYLELVKLHPPDTDADKFHSIYEAYELLKDPLKQAKAIAYFDREIPNVNQWISDATIEKPRLPKLPLLSLGN
jgi:DnaJ-class molecular chaperone